MEESLSDFKKELLTDRGDERVRRFFVVVESPLKEFAILCEKYELGVVNCGRKWNDKEVFAIF
jgi:hypothetical protein